MSWSLSSFTESVAAGLVAAAILAAAAVVWASVRRATGYAVATVGIVVFAAVVTIFNQLGGIEGRRNPKGAEVSLEKPIDAAADSFRFVQWVPSETECNAMIDGSQSSSAIRDKYDVAIACGISDAKTDKFRDTRITITQLFTIQKGVMPIAAFARKEMASGIAQDRERALNESPYQKGTLVTVSQTIWWRVVLLPKGTDMGEIRRLSDVLLHGGGVSKNEVAATLLVSKKK